MSGQRIQQEAICYQWFKQRLILSVSKPSISQRSQIKEDTYLASLGGYSCRLQWCQSLWRTKAARAP